MPVYGLPLSLEASLNSLVELRPPTSWRVSGHGDEVTVVLRWTLSGSPSSDKTLDYDMNPCPRPNSHVATSRPWSRGVKQKLSPGAEVKTRSSSVHDCRLTSGLQPKYDCLQPFKLRKLDIASQRTPHSPASQRIPHSPASQRTPHFPASQLITHSPSPVPVYITVADGTFQPSSPGLLRKRHSHGCDSVRPEHGHADSPLGNNHPTNREGQLETQAETPVKQHLTPTQAETSVEQHLTPTQAETLVKQHLTPTNASPVAHRESQGDKRTYLTPTNASPTPHREDLGDKRTYLTPTNASPTPHREKLVASRTYLTPCSSRLSLDIPSATLDEKSGLFTDGQHLVAQPDFEVKVDSGKCERPTLIDPSQNDSGCASESNSTSLSHYVRHTLSQDSSSRDGFGGKSASTSGSDQGSHSDNRCSSAGSSVSRSSFALQSCSSKAKMESMDSSNEDTNLMDEKDDDCHSHDLDMVCSNEVEQEQVQADSESSRSSISYWDSFDSLQSDPLPAGVDAGEATSGQTSHNCLSLDSGQHGDFTV